VPERITHDDLMRFIDGELAPEDHARIEAQLRTSTELQREVAIFNAMKTDFQDLSFQPAGSGHSVWDRVNRQLTRPVGWLLMIGGAAVLVAYGVFVFATSPGDPWEKLAIAAVVIGFVVLLGSVVWERYRDWLHDPYRDVYR